MADARRQPGCFLEAFALLFAAPPHIMHHDSCGLKAANASPNPSLDATRCNIAVCGSSAHGYSLYCVNSCTEVFSAYIDIAHTA